MQRIGPFFAHAGLSLAVALFAASAARAQDATKPDSAKPEEPAPAPDLAKDLEDQEKETAAKIAATEAAATSWNWPKVRGVTFGGHIMVRGEYRKHSSYAPTATPKLDASTITERVRLFTDLDVNEHLRAKLTIQDTRVWGTEGGLTTNTGNLDLFEGFVELRKLWDAPLSIKAGRMAVPRIGDQRIMSDLIWHGYTRSWDGVHATYNPEGWNLHLIATNVMEAGNLTTPFDADDDHWVMVADWEYRGIENVEFDLYAVARLFDQKTFASETGVGPLDEKRDITLAARGKWKNESLWVTGELAVQGGRQGRDDIFAWAGAARANYTLSTEGFAPAVYAEYAYASGDTRPTDGKINRFDPILPFGHNYHGHADQIQWSNVHAVMAGAKVDLGGLSETLGGWNLHVDGHAFWLASRRDAWINAGGTAVRRDPTRTVAGSGAIGSEVDVYVKGKLFKNLSVWGGWSHFFPGVFVHDTAPLNDRDQDWVFLHLVLGF